MSQIFRHQWIVVAVAAVVFFTRLGGAYLWDEDEPKNAACAREMLERGDWVTPSFNYDLRTDKPVLLYWLMMTAYRTFGVNEFAARFWSAMAGVGVSLVVYHLGRLLFRAEVGLWAGLIMATSLMFDVAGRAATPDASFILWATSAMLAFVWAEGRARHSSLDGASTDARWAPWRYAPMYLCMGIAVLAKGPAGVVLPLMAMGVYLTVLRDMNTTSARDGVPGAAAAGVWGRLAVWRNFALVALNPARWWRISRRIYLAEGALVVLAVALPWYIWVGVRTDGEWLRGFLLKHNVGRFTASMENHSGPILYYIPAIIIGFFPWSVFLPLSIRNAALRIAANQRDRAAYLLISCWAAAQVGFFSLAATKLPSYVLPAYPAIALLTAAFLDRWLAEPLAVPKGLLRWALVSPALVGLGVVIALPIVAAKFAPGEAWLALLGLVPIAQAIAALYWSETARPRPALVSFAALTVVFVVSLFGVAAVRISRHHSNGPLMAEAHRLNGVQAPLATYRHFEPTLAFYAASRLEPRDEPAQVAAFLATSDDALVVTRDEFVDELLAQVPGAQVVARRKRFLRDGEVVLIGQAPRTATHTTDETRR